MFFRVEVCGCQDLVAFSPNASGSLRKEHGIQDMLSINVKCSVVIQMILSPCKISLGYHFKKMALSSIKCRSNALEL